MKSGVRTVINFSVNLAEYTKSNAKGAKTLLKAMQDKNTLKIRRVDYGRYK